jgi:hypothetical protein
LLNDADVFFSNRSPGYQEPVTGVFALEGTPDSPRLPPIRIVCDYIVGWFTSVGIMSALCRRAVEGGSYRVVVSLAGVTLWLLSLGIFDRGGDFMLGLEAIFPIGILKLTGPIYYELL